MKVWYINPNETAYQRANRERQARIKKANFEKKIGYKKSEVKENGK